MLAQQETEMKLMLLILGTTLAGCISPTEPEAPAQFEPTLACPGATNCPDNNGALLAGAATRSVVPSCFEDYIDTNNNNEYEPSSGDTFLDCGCDRLCPEDEGYPGLDEGEGDGEFQAIWIAGFQSSRAAKAVRGADIGLIGATDGLYANAVVLEQGSSRLAIVVIDGFGWMNEQVLAIRQELKDRGVELDHVLVHSSHSHASPDTLGIYGRNPTKSGFSQDYADEVRDQVADAIEEAVSALRPVTMKVGSTDLSEASEIGVANYIRDARDPWVIDPTLGVIQFQDSATEETVATLVNWANHPEASANDFSYLSADFVHGLRTAVTEGATWESYSRSGVGGVCVFLNGTVGGMMTPLGVANTDPDGVTRQAASFEKADAIGLQVGELTLDALEQGTLVTDPSLRFAQQTLYLPIHNTAFQAMYLLNVLPRTAYNFDESKPLDADNTPEIFTEINVIEIGPVQLLALPGEVLPELAIGGYDGSHIHSPGQPIVDPDNPNPPDLSQAPAGPYWKDYLTTEHKWIVGLANDQVGYIIPEYNFILHDAGPYLAEAEGDHYEETNSLGPETAKRLDAEIVALTQWFGNQ
jgi:hypothetical protein